MSWCFILSLSSKCVPLDCFCVFWFPVVRFIFFLPLVSHFVGIERLWVYNMIMIRSLLFLHFPVHFVSTFNLCLKFWGYIWILQGKKKELIFIWKLLLHSVFVLGFSFFPLPSPLLPGGGALFCFCLSALVVFKHMCSCACFFYVVVLLSWTHGSKLCGHWITVSLWKLRVGMTRKACCYTNFDKRRLLYFHLLYCLWTFSFLLRFDFLSDFVIVSFIVDEIF